MRIAVDGAIDDELEQAYNATTVVRVADPLIDGLKTVLAEFIDPGLGQIDELLALGFFSVMTNMLTDTYEVPWENPFPPSD